MATREKILGVKTIADVQKIGGRTVSAEVVQGTTAKKMVVKCRYEDVREFTEYPMRHVPIEVPSYADNQLSRFESVLRELDDEGIEYDVCVHTTASEYEKYMADSDVTVKAKQLLATAQALSPNPAARARRGNKLLRSIRFREGKAYVRLAGSPDVYEIDVTST